jgi:alpha-L-arabinofuranosidase
MKFKQITVVVFLVVLSYLPGLSYAQTTNITVKADKPISEIQPTMWGIFFEDINFGADGGIYAELVKNRSFEFDAPLMGWNVEKQEIDRGHFIIVNRVEKKSNNPRYAQLKLDGSNSISITNEGFRGMGIKKDNQYDFSVLARLNSGNVNLKIEIVDSKGQTIGSTSLAINGADWKSYKATLSSTATDPKSKLKITFEGNGAADFDMISLFPKDTWKGRPNGLRKDLIQLLADLKPGFLRFPGGCIVEGRDLESRYQWKKTVGNIEDREMIVNRWNTEFKHRPAPDYYQTFGVGFYEYFQLAEDIGAEPLPILSCGMACQFNTSEVVPMNQLDPFVQDALDLIEFANGDESTKWGKLRADMGHKAPFNLKLIGVGNEQWGPQYIERYKVFENAIRAKYPKIKIVTGTGPFPEGEYFDYAKAELKKLNADIIDEHYYNKPEWFLQNATRYDKYDRNGPKIFAGEYAAQSVAIASPDNKNNWDCALSEAAFMTGLERNAEVVNLASYAPLFAHAEGWQWTPDLIWFDNLNSYGTANYYVQKLYSTNKGTHVLATTNNGAALTGQNGLYASSVLDKKTNEIIVKLVNASDKEQTAKVQVDGVAKLDSKGKMSVLKSNNKQSENSFKNPLEIAPVDGQVKVKGRAVEAILAPNSFSVIRVKVL